jgi:hypothetical protein
MDEIRSRGPRPGPANGRILAGIATAAVVLGLASYDPRLLFAVLFLAIYAGSYLLTSTPRPRQTPEADVRTPRRLRYSIWQIMVVSVVVAFLAVLVRALAPYVAAISSPTLLAILGVGVGILAIPVSLTYVVWFVAGVIRLSAKPKTGE